MITPDTPAAPAAKSRQCVPVAALAVDGTAPAAGDEADVTGKIRVTAVEGDKAYFELAEVNGEAVSNDSAAAPAEEDPMEAAQKADDEESELEG